MDVQRLTLAQILGLVQTKPEQIVFDTKRDFTLPRDDAARAEFIKDSIAVANGTALTRGPGFVIYGVDPRVPGAVTGITEQYDDAKLQQLVAAHVDPVIEFLFYDDVDAGDGKRIAVLHIAASSQPFHVVAKDVGGLRDGTSFIRQGSSTRGLRRADWMRLCLGHDSPYLAHALQKYGAAAALINAQTASLQTNQQMQQALLRQMESMSGLPRGTLG